MKNLHILPKVEGLRGCIKGPYRLRDMH